MEFPGTVLKVTSFRRFVSPLRRMLRAFILLISPLLFLSPALSETTHSVHFPGTESQLDVYRIRGTSPGPTLLLLGGIQGDEPGGYLAADLYADLTLKRGNLIVVPRANFLSIVENSRGVEGDMNRKFATTPKGPDREAAVVGIIKELMRKSDFFLNLHDGSGYFAPRYETPLRNPMRFGQSVIADADEFTRPDGKVIPMGKMVQKVLQQVNTQIPQDEHHFKFNNHRTSLSDSKHKEQRLSATFHALTQVGIPAFGIETSKEISDYRLRVRYQTMVINAFLEEFGIIPDNPRMYLETPQLKYLVVSINGRTPIVANTQDTIKVSQGDRVRIVHAEANYSRGLTARIKGSGRKLDDMNYDVTITQNSLIEVRKDRFVIAKIPIESGAAGPPPPGIVHFEPRVNYFCVRVNDRTFVVEPGEELSVLRGDTIVILDPKTNLDAENEKSIRVDLRGFQADNSPYPLEDRGHRIETATDLQEKFGKVRRGASVFALQAKKNNKVIAECSLVVEEPRMEYLLFREQAGGTYVAYPGDKLELPETGVLRIVDIKTNIPNSSSLSLTMSGKTIPWDQKGTAGIDGSKLDSGEIPLDITRQGRSLGRIWIKQGAAIKTSSGEPSKLRSPLSPVNY